MNFFLLALSSFLFLASCGSLTKGILKDPEVEVVGFNVTDINLSDVTMAVTMNVKNPNSVALSLDKVAYELNFSGEKVTEGVFSDGLNVPALGESSVTIPFNFKFNSIGNILTGIINKTLTKEYELKGHAKLGIFSVPFSKKGEVNLKK